MSSFLTPVQPTFRPRPRPGSGLRYLSIRTELGIEINFYFRFSPNSQSQSTMARASRSAPVLHPIRILSNWEDRENFRLSLIRPRRRELDARRERHLFPIHTLFLTWFVLVSTNWCPIGKRGSFRLFTIRKHGLLRRERNREENMISNR
jgi:hypothetical protein